MTTKMKVRTREERKEKREKQEGKVSPKDQTPIPKRVKSVSEGLPK